MLKSQGGVPKGLLLPDDVPDPHCLPSGLIPRPSANTQSTIAWDSKQRPPPNQMATSTSTSRALRMRLLSSGRAMRHQMLPSPDLFA